VRRRFQTRSDNAPNYHPKTSLVECVQQLFMPRALTRLPTSYPALRFWLSTPTAYPGAPCTYPAEAPTTFFRRVAPVRLPGDLDWSANARPIDICSRQPAKPKCLDHAQELTRLAHPAPDSMSPVSLFLGLPVGGSQAAATCSARGPVGPTLWEQAPRQVSNCSRLLRKPPKAYNLALAAHIHRGDFAAPEIPQATHMGKVLP